MPGGTAKAIGVLQTTCLLVMSRNPNSQNTLISAEEVQTQRDPRRSALEQTVDDRSENRDCLGAALIQSHSEQTSSIQTWINNIQLYRFPLALTVVAVHSGEFVATLSRTAFSGGDSILGLWLVDFLTTISRLATPSFLLISGLIFCKDGKVSHDQYRRKVRSRCRTLLVPYLAWNFLAVLLLCAPSAIKYFFFAPGSYTYTPLTLSGLVNWMVGWPVYPADRPLWFVRDLFLLIAIVPMLNFIPQRAQMIGLGTLFMYWLLGPIDVIPGGVPRAFSVLFFMIGVVMGMNPGLLRAITGAKWLIYATAAVLLFSAAGGATCSTLGEDYSGLRSFLEKMVRISGALLVVCAGARGRFPAWLSVRLHRVSPVAFFLFASHYLGFVYITPLFAGAAQGPLGQGHEVLLFGLISSTVIAVSLGSYFLLKRYAPSLLGLLDGNRSARGSADDRVQRQFEVETLRNPKLAPL